MTTPSHALHYTLPSSLTSELAHPAGASMGSCAHQWQGDVVQLACEYDSARGARGDAGGSAHRGAGPCECPLVSQAACTTTCTMMPTPASDAAGEYVTVHVLLAIIVAGLVKNNHMDEDKTSLASHLIPAECNGLSSTLSRNLAYLFLICSWFG